MNVGSVWDFKNRIGTLANKVDGKLKTAIESLEEGEHWALKPEFAEDNEDGAWSDLSKFDLNEKDTVVGITASGTTPYVLGGIKKCREHHLLTAGISCNPNSPLSDLAEIAIEAVVGPEVVTGSTRMKSGTAQKMILNLISTTLMIRAGLVLDNKMVNMQLSNNKLWDRGVRYIVEALSISNDEALAALKKHGSVQSVLNAYAE